MFSNECTSMFCLDRRAGISVRMFIYLMVSSQKVQIKLTFFLEEQTYLYIWSIVFNVLHGSVMGLWFVTDDLASKS